MGGDGGEQFRFFEMREGKKKRKKKGHVTCIVHYNTCTYICTVTLTTIVT